MEEINKSTSPGLVHRTFSGFIWVLFGSGVQVALKIGVLAILGRLVTPGDFGLMGIAMIVIEFSKMFSHMGIGPALVQRKEIEERHLVTGLTLSIILGAFFALLLLCSASQMALFFRMPGLDKILCVLALIFLIDSFTLIAQALLQRNMRFKLSAGIEVISYTLGYGIVGIFLAHLGLGVWALVCASLTQSCLLTIFMLMAQPFPKKLGFEIKAFRELILFGGGFTLAKLANFLATQGDNLVVGRMLGATALGIYGRAYQFMVMPAGLFGNALDRALFPAMAKVQSEKPRLAKAYLTGVSLIALVSVPVSFLTFILAPEIIMVLLGPEWTAVIVPFQILTCGLLFRMSYKMSESLARATGAVYRRAWRQIIYATMVLAGSYFGQFWGLPGVACGVVIALVINFSFMAQLSFQLTGLNWMDMVKAHKHGLLAGLITWAATSGIATLCRMENLPDILTLLLSGLGAGTTLLLTFIFFPGTMMNQETKEMTEKLIPKRFKGFLFKHA